jgi:GNAT superfamily N-acetyltransferase
VKPTPELLLRRPDPKRFAGDVAATAKLFVESRLAMLPDLRVAHTPEETLAWMRDVLFPRQSVRLAELRGEIVGFASRDGVWLSNLYVKPGWTGHGIGQRLLDAMLAEAAPAIPALRLWAFQRNAGARRFYERNGFVAVEFTDGAGNEEHEPDVRYERALRR